MDLLKTTEAAFLPAHLVAHCIGFPFMLEGILKSAGSLADVLWTCFEYKWSPPLSRVHHAASFWVILHTGGYAGSEYFYMKAHSDLVNQPARIVAKEERLRLSVFIATGAPALSGENKAITEPGFPALKGCGFVGRQTNSKVNLVWSWMFVLFLVSVYLFLSNSRR